MSSGAKLGHMEDCSVCIFHYLSPPSKKKERKTKDYLKIFIQLKWISPRFYVPTYIKCVVSPAEKTQLKVTQALYFTQFLIIESDGNNGDVTRTVCTYTCCT